MTQLRKMTSTNSSAAITPKLPHECASPLSGSSLRMTGGSHSDTYVVCLDCGKQFEYDLKTMQMGKAIDHGAGVLPLNMPKPRKTKVKYALLAAVPLAVVVGAALKGRKKPVTPEGVKPEKHVSADEPHAVSNDELRH